jgi:hypothetical protein
MQVVATFRLPIPLGKLQQLNTLCQSLYAMPGHELHMRENPPKSGILEIIRIRKQTHDPIDNTKIDFNKTVRATRMSPPTPEEPT